MPACRSAVVFGPFAGAFAALSLLWPTAAAADGPGFTLDWQSEPACDGGVRRRVEQLLGARLDEAAASVAAGISSAAVEAALAGSAVAGTAGSVAAGHGVMTALAVWGGAGIVTGVAVTTASVAVLRATSPEPDRPTSSVAVRPKRPLAPVATASVVRASPPPPETSSEAAPDAVAQGRHPGVAEELRLLAEARTALRDGDPERALAMSLERLSIERRMPFWAEAALG